MLAVTGTLAFRVRDEGMIIIRLLGEQAEILTLAVRPAARRRGIAAALLQRAEDTARAQQATRMFLEVGADNEAAGGLYGRAGYKEISRRKGYYHRGGAEYADALVMAKELA